MAAKMGGPMATTEQTRCPACLALNDADADECAACGAVMDGNAEPVEPTGGTQTNAAAPPRDNLIRALPGWAGKSEWRATEGDPLGELFGQFSQYRTWYEVDSMWEGRFMERIMPGAFTDTIANDKASMRILLNHGMDALGLLPLASLRTLEDRPEGPYYEAPLYDTAFNRDNVVPILQGKLMNGGKAESGFGASMRFTVQEDSWNRRAKADKYNPEALPERSITRAKVYEFGPVTYPANEGATAAARSLSDEWLARLIGDKRFADSFTERVGTKVVERVLATVPEEIRAALASRPDPARERHRLYLQRQARALLVIG